jgi:AcrR family transcriptional regulator
MDPGATSGNLELSFRRPARGHALELARAQFLAGQRLEMGALAEELDIGRTTLYRWVGEREQLIGEVLGGLVDEWVAIVEPEATGSGVDRILDFLRRYLEFAADSVPLTAFAEREPALALRLMIDRRGRVAERSDRALRRLLEEMVPDLQVPAKIIEAIAMSAVTLVWANIATGQEPDIEGAVSLASTLLGTCEAR